MEFQQTRLQETGLFMNKLPSSIWTFYGKRSISRKCATAHVMQQNDEHWQNGLHLSPNLSVLVQLYHFRNRQIKKFMGSELFLKEMQADEIF